MQGAGSGTGKRELGRGGVMSWIATDCPGMSPDDLPYVFSPISSSPSLKIGTSQVSGWQSRVVYTGQGGSITPRLMCWGDWGG